MAELDARRAEQRLKGQELFSVQTSLLVGAEIMKKVAEAKASREAAAKEAEEQRTAFYGNSPLPRAPSFCPR